MSEGPTAADFRDVLDEYWHDRPPASLEDVMALYGVLGWLRAVGALHDPSKLDPFVDDGRLITVSLDLTGDTPEFTSIEQDSLREDDIPKLGYSHKSSGRGAKYSLHKSGRNTGTTQKE